MNIIKRLLICLTFILLTTSLNAQLNPECNNIIGTIVNQTPGSPSCISVPLSPPVIAAGTQITQCFSYQFIGPANLSFLIVTGSCGPFPPYNSLTYQIYNMTCDTLVASGNIFPFNVTNDTYIDNLNIFEWYIICYTWTANCSQTDVCAIIYTSLLPIEMKEFYVDFDKATNSNILCWSTYSEINNQYFLVERSSDCQAWETLETIPGAGNSNSIKSYQYIDTSPLKGLNYYRLKQVDYDGKFKYSDIIMSNTYFDEDKFVLLPNPVQNVLYVYSVSKNIKHVLIEIEDQTGKQIYCNDNMVISNGNRLEINTESFAKGIYLISILDKYNSKQITYKFVKN